MPTLHNLAVLAPLLLVGCVADPTRVPPPAATGLGDPHDWKTGLYGAVRDGDADRVRQFLVAYPELLDETERFTKCPLTPLEIAAERNQLGVMGLLIERGADVKAGRPLWLAAYHDHREAAELLLKHGATLDLYSAVALDRRAEVERMLRVAAVFGRGKRLANARCAVFGDEVPVVRVASDKGLAEMVKLLVRHGADPDAKSIHRPSYISDNNFKGVTVGLTPAGTSAPDLVVPVRKQ